MWALELVRHGFESCTLCSDTQQFCGLEQVSSLVIPSNLFPNSKAVISHNTHRFCPFSSFWLSFFLLFSPFSFLFLPLSCVWQAPPPPPPRLTSHEPCTEERHFSTLCNVNLTSPKEPVEIHRDSCSPCNMQGFAETRTCNDLDLRAGIISSNQSQ